MKSLGTAALIIIALAISSLMPFSPALACDASCVAARKAANPLADIKAIITDNTVSYQTGTNSEDSYNFQLQPVYALPISSNANLVIRGIVPFLGVQPGAALPPGIPGPSPNSGLVEGLGDTTVQLFYAPTPGENGLALGFGGQVSLPTRSNSSLAGAGWGAGPAFVLFGQTGNLSWGGVLGHMWGEEKFSTSVLQPIITYGLGKGWYVGYNNVISYNWNAPSSSEALQVPIGLYGGRTIALNDEGSAVDLNIGYYGIRRTPAGGPDSQFKFGISYFF